MAKQTIVFAATVASHLRMFHLPWVNVLRSSGYQVIGAASDVGSCERCRAGFDRVVDVPFSRSVFSLKQLSSSGRAMRALCDATSPSLVHFHTPNAAFWGRWGLSRLVKRQAIKTAYTAHGFHFHRGRTWLSNTIFYIAESLAARYTHALLTINGEDYEAAQRLRLAPGGFVGHVPGIGLDMNRFGLQAEEVKERGSIIREGLGIWPKTRVLLMVAEFSPGKRHRDLIRAVTQCANENLLVLFAGTGKKLADSERLVQELGLQDHIRFLGFRSDIPDLLAGADVVVMPSEREGLPACVMEAMAMGCPVIGANARGTRDLLSPDCGWLYEVGDTESLARLIDDVFRKPSEALFRARRARDKIFAQYSWPVVRSKLSEVYKRLGFSINSAD